MTSALLINNKNSELNSFFSVSDNSQISSESSSSQSQTSSSISSSSSSNSSSSNGAIASLCKSSHQFTHIINTQPIAQAELETDTKNSGIANDISTSFNRQQIGIVQNLRNLINTNLVKDDAQQQCQSVEIPVVHVPSIQPQNSGSLSTSISSSTSSSSSCSQFIDPSELKNKFYEFSSKFLLILLDCRTYNDFNLKHIKDSVHLNCRDKLTRKRLQSRKLTVKDLISSEEIKNKFEAAPVSGEQAVQNVAEYTDNFIQSIKTDKTDNNMIVLYDDTTSDLSDLQSDQNPLKIVQENIKQSGYRKDCRILKGGFKSFFESFPEFCILKDIDEQQRAFLAKHKEYFKEKRDDQRQSAIDNAVMTEITPYLFLGNESDAKNLDILEKKGIYYILNVTKNIPFYNSTNTMNSNVNNSNSSNQFCLKRIAVNDCENQNLKNHFNEAFEFIDQAKLKNQKVLVHCQAGISRSPTIVIAYLMSRFNLKMNDAYNQVKVHRPIIGPNLIFMSQLMDYETNLETNTLNKLNNKSNNVTSINVFHSNSSETTQSINSSTPRLLKPNTPPSTPTTQIEVQFIKTNSNHRNENSENNSPDAQANNSNSYFKLAQSANNSKCMNNNNNNNGETNNSILVLN